MKNISHMASFSVLFLAEVMTLHCICCRQWDYDCFSNDCKSFQNSGKSLSEEVVIMICLEAFLRVSGELVNVFQQPCFLSNAAGLWLPDQCSTILYNLI